MGHVTRQILPPGNVLDSLRSIRESSSSSTFTRVSPSSQGMLMAIDSIFSLWQFVSMAVSLLMLGVWIAGFVLSLWIMRWYAGAGGCLALGTGLPAISTLVYGITQAVLLSQQFTNGTFYTNGDSELVQILTLTNMVCSMLTSVGIVALIAGIWLLAKRCRELQLAD